MMKRIESVLEQERPQWVLLYGDTNSTVAGALVASKMGLRAAHVEAGLRSYNRRMPEELNRVVTDHLSDLLLCPTSLALKNLVKEGLGERAVITGDVMFDAAVNYTRAAETRYPALAEEWRPGAFALATVHRAENVDDPQRLREIIAALETVAGTICPVVLPLHPRTRKTLSAMGLTLSHVTVYRPVSYLEMLLLESRARFVITDSGGVQKEAYFARVPCITVRDETEWEETLENDCNVLTGADRTRILAAVERSTSAGPWDVVYGDGRAGSAVLRAMMEFDGASKALA
jgi:UDP-GlcNAc3NAcA epimerase